jgi:hypothetical protein
LIINSNSTNFKKATINPKLQFGEMVQNKKALAIILKHNIDNKLLLAKATFYYCTPLN